MLYDKRWDATPATKPADPFTLPALIAWLETMPGDEQYDYWDCHGGCLYGQYVMHCGIAWENSGGKLSCDATREANNFCAYVYEHIACTEPYTFGAALTRARKALSDQQSRGVADPSREAV